MNAKRPAALTDLRGKHCFQHRRHFLTVVGVRQTAAHAQRFQPGCVVELVEEERNQKLRQSRAQALSRRADAAVMDES